MLLTSVFNIYNNFKHAAILYLLLYINSMQKNLSLKQFKTLKGCQCEILKASAESAGGKLSLKDAKTV